jgi:hypothetical protein
VALWYVLYNKKNNEFVGFGGAYGATMHVYTSTYPEGPFTHRSPFPSVPGGMGDIFMYADDTDSSSNKADAAYLVYNAYHGAVHERFTFVIQLDDDFYGVVPSTLANTTAVVEGLWMFNREGTHYLVGSYLSG